MPESWTTYSNYMSALMLTAMIGTTALYATYTEDSNKIRSLQFLVYLCFTAGCIFALMQYVVATYYRTSG
jgi:hypothetical protein